MSARIRQRSNNSLNWLHQHLVASQYGPLLAAD